MGTVSSLLIASILVYVLLGVIWYVLDRIFGVKLYGWWYKKTHESPLPKEKDMGFIYNRSTRSKIVIATVISIAQTVLILFTSSSNVLVELVMLVIEIPVTLTGFALGPFIYGIWSRKEQVLEVVDDIESGKIDIKKQVEDQIGFIGGKMKEMANVVSENSYFKEEKLPEEKPKVEKKEDPEIDPRKSIDKFINR